MGERAPSFAPRPAGARRSGRTHRGQGSRAHPPCVDDPAAEPQIAIAQVEVGRSPTCCDRDAEFFTSCSVEHVERMLLRFDVTARQVRDVRVPLLLRVAVAREHVAVAVQKAYDQVRESIALAGCHRFSVRGGGSAAPGRAAGDGAGRLHASWRNMGATPVLFWAEAASERAARDHGCRAVHGGRGLCRCHRRGVRSPSMLWRARR